MRSKPIGRNAEDLSAVPVAGAKAAILNGTRTVRISAGADIYVGIGNSGTVPAAATTNTVLQKSGEKDYNLDGVFQTDGAYIYVYALTSTAAVVISFLG